MNKVGWLISAAKKPVEASMFVYSTGLFFLSLFIMSPFYHAAVSSPFSTFYGQRALEFFVAVFFLASSLPGLIVPFVREEKRMRWLKHSTFGIFLSFLFLFVLRVAVAGWIPLIWIYPLLISLSSGVKRLFLEVRKE